MQEEALFPVVGSIPNSSGNAAANWVKDQGYDNELAYMKVMLDYPEMDRPTNADLRKLGERLTFYKGLPGDVRGFQIRAAFASNMRPMASRSNITSCPPTGRPARGQQASLLM